MSEQIAMFPFVEKRNNEKKQDQKKRRRWEDAFQKWSNEHMLNGDDSLGSCGFGDMCDWCKDNDFGRPCVRALNAMCREKNLQIDYSDYDFEKVW